MKRRAAVAIAACVTTLVAASPWMGSLAEAQAPVKPVTIAGVVRDTAGRALLAAEVRAGDRWVTSDREGKFVLDSVPADTIPLQIRRIGYKVEDVLLVASPGDRVEIAVRLTPIEVTLGTIVVQGKRMDTFLMKNGWYDRTRLGMGVQFDPDYLQHFGGTLSGLLYNVPSVRIERDQFGRATALVNMNGMYMCALNVFLDGVYVPWAIDAGIDDVIPKQLILAVEVYKRGVEIPQSFGRAGTTGTGGLPAGVAQAAQAEKGDPKCGAIMIWTKPPGSVDKQKSK